MSTFRLPRLYPILDAGAAEKAGVSPFVLAKGWVDAGVEVVQFRHKGPFTREAFETAAAVGEIARAAGALYVLNDRVDVALMVGAGGVHVGQDDLPPDAVRHLGGPEMILGFSTHNEAQFRAGDLESVDYLAFGPIFGTQTKENPDPTVGVSELKRIRGLTAKPVVAIGGITRQNVADVLAAGADSVAVISDLLRGDPKTTIREWLAAVGE